MLRIRQTRDLLTLRFLHEEIFPTDELPVCDRTIIWFIYDGKIPIGFCLLKDMGDYVYFSLAGIIPKYRGRGLQKRLISTRLRWARKNKKTKAITYTLLDNHASSNSLIRKGFILYSPEFCWVEGKVHYWIKEL